MKPKYIFISFIIVLILSSCSSRFYTTYISSYGSDLSLKSKNFFILPSQSTDGNNFEFEELSSWLQKGLKLRGYNLVSEIEKADVVIDFKYNVGDPKTEVQQHVVGIYGQNGVRSSSTTTSISSNSSNIVSKTTNNPSYGLIGATTVSNNVTKYSINIQINAYDRILYSNNEKKMIWKTDITDQNSISDLRREMPKYIFASLDYLGKSTGERIFVKFYLNDNKFIEFMNLK